MLPLTEILSGSRSPGAIRLSGLGSITVVNVNGGRRSRDSRPAEHQLPGKRLV